MSSVFDGMASKPEEASEFLQWWFSGSGITPDSLISLVRIQPTSPKVLSLTFTLDEIIGAISTSGLEPIMYDHQGSPYDLYFAVGTSKERPAGNKRGSLKNVNKIPGLWVDLDVKPGSFGSKDEVRAYLNSLEVKPSAVVFTGSGGAHAYWKFTAPQSSETVRTDALSWWAYQQSLCPVVIDKLCDPTRILRLPGSVRWPKKSDEAPAPVYTVYTGLTYDPADLRQVSSQAWESYSNKIKDRQQRVHNGVLEANNKLRSFDPNNYWGNLMAIANLEEWFSQKYSWSGILVPMGWTYLGEDEENRALWSRPGDGYRKSATTDWPESPDIMSLFSSSEETGLFELYESSIILTKYRVYVQLYCGGDDSLAIDALRNEFLGDTEYWDRLR